MDNLGDKAIMQTAKVSEIVYTSQFKQPANVRG
jgi:hypothetical protein